MTRLWDKGTPLDERVLRYTAGDDHVLDNRLVAYDVLASIAHAEMLYAQKLLAPADLEAIRKALTDIGAEHARGEWQVRLEHEDGQTALENLLTARIGEAGERVHLGRSRNDQVLTALRLYLRDAIGALIEAVKRDSQRARPTGAARGGNRPPRLHAHATSHAEFGRALGRRIRRGVTRRRGWTAPGATAGAEESARLGSRIRHAELAVES